MCSPEIMAKVAEVSRRDLIKRTSVAGLAGAAAFGGLTLPARAQTGTPAAGATPIGTPVAQAGLFSSMLDLTHTWDEEFPMFPGAEQPSIEVIVTIADNGFYKNRLTLDEHTGTHMDAPGHFDEEGQTADQLQIENLVAPLVVIDISDRAASDPDAQGMPDDILAWESANGPLPQGAFVALNSGWDAKVNDPEAYINLDTDDVAHFPGWHPDAAAFLVNERNIVGVGVDTVSLDFGASTDFGTHLTILPAGRYGIENLANLGQAPVSGGWIIIGGPKHATASGGPVRAYAVTQ
jgi:kynurenine formamidase